MNNFEKYSKLHSEVMARLENGDITVEAAKDVIDLSFNKYIAEATEIILPLTQEDKNRLNIKINGDLTEALMNLDHEYKKKIKDASTDDERAALLKELKEKKEDEQAKANAKLTKVMKAPLKK